MGRHVDADGIAVGNELAIAHPGDDTALGFTLLTFGGAALFLSAQIFFLRQVLGQAPRSRAFGLAALAILRRRPRHSR